MNTENLYEVLVKALNESKFTLNVNPATMLSLWCIPQAGYIMTNSDGVERSSELQAEFENIKQYSKVVAFRFFLGQPVVAIAVEADSLAPDQMREISLSFNECLVKSLNYTMKSKNALGRESQVGGAFGILLFIFFDSAQADHFVASHQANCYMRDRKKNITVRPWAIDVSRKKVIPESKSWFSDMGTLSSKKFEKLIF
jgi:hypothetical protein